MELRVQTRLTDFAPFLRFHLLPRHTCARLQPSHAVQSVKLSKRKKEEALLFFFFFVFSLGASASHAIAVFWSRAKPADDTSHFLPPFPSFCFVCARGREKFVAAKYGLICQRDAGLKYSGGGWKTGGGEEGGVWSSGLNTAFKGNLKCL